MYYSYGILLGGSFMASRSLYSIFRGSWILKFSEVFHGIFQVFFMALRPWKCHWFNHENPVKNPWIYNELFHKIFMGFDFRVCSSWCFEQIFEDRASFFFRGSARCQYQLKLYCLSMTDNFGLGKWAKIERNYGKLLRV